MIYCVEDDDSIRELEVYTLRATGFEAEGFADGAGFFEALEKELPELVLLDIMLPDEDGLSILHRLRSRRSTEQIPIILATAKGSEYDKVKGLDGGADDYLAKPFGMMELVSRVKAVLRRAVRQPKLSVLSAGSIQLDSDARRVFVGEEEITLTLKEFDLLQYLLENSGRVLTRDQLLIHIWGYDFDGETRTVDVHIRTLRNKLGEAGQAIETVRGMGYRIGGNR
ncbi:response regulator transcription factor [Cuneatibacter sp. NSJ-177]|uniref:winged helix-turn-helix domain-containing protein n=1 Tax=Cuneatibacter sp. NSJ-177 TaxID=2931401 RepID=UPI001FD62BF4|nr:response regulator transcription factor [Cuneatibacter sp. NSJ-177]MCJ7836260.1 response regulator transcription factor [Cuneatibacter sp. NSJ-177]